MKIKVDWFNQEKTIILQKRKKGWTWDDFDAAVDQYVALANSVDHKVAIIIDSLDAPKSPSALVLEHYRRADMLKPAHLVLMVVVTTGGFMQNMGKVYATADQGVEEFLHFVKSIEEAEALCNEVLSSGSNEE